eukprot:4951579-Pleurochrysis_carterae.AAC.1
MSAKTREMSAKTRENERKIQQAEAAKDFETSAGRRARVDARTSQVEQLVSTCLPIDTCCYPSRSLSIPSPSPRRLAARLNIHAYTSLPTPTQTCQWTVYIAGYLLSHTSACSSACPLTQLIPKQRTQLCRHMPSCMAACLAALQGHFLPAYLPINLSI